MFPSFRAHPSSSITTTPLLLLTFPSHHAQGPEPANSLQLRVNFCNCCVLTSYFPAFQLSPLRNSYFCNMIGDEEYFFPQRIIERLQEKLQERAKPSYKAWFAEYLKNVAPVRGVPMQEIRFAVSKWNAEWHLEQQSVPMELQISVSLLLLQSNFIEDQLAGIVFLDEILIPNAVVTHSTLPHFEQLFLAGCITSFKVCDHFSSKVLQPLIIRHGTAVTETLAKWFDAPSVWQARSALGSLVPFANDAIYDELILTGCDKLVRRIEEDAKSVVGSALKALGKRNFRIVEDFFGIDDHLACINASGLTKACESLPGGDERPRQFRAKRRLLVQQGVAKQAEMEMQQQLAAIRSSEDRGRILHEAGSSTEHAAQAEQERLMSAGSGSWQGDIGIPEEEFESVEQEGETEFQQETEQCYYLADCLIKP